MKMHSHWWFMKKPKSSTCSQKSSVSGCEITWNFLYRILNIYLTFLLAHKKYQHRSQPPRRQWQQGICSMCVLVDHSCHRGAEQSGHYQRWEERVLNCVSSNALWLHRPQPLSYQRQSGQRQNYLSRSPTQKWAGSTWLLASGGKVTGTKACRGLVGHHADHDQALCPYSKDCQQPPRSWSFPSTQHWWATARAQGTVLDSQEEIVGLAVSFCFGLLIFKWLKIIHINMAGDATLFKSSLANA